MPTAAPAEYDRQMRVQTPGPGPLFPDQGRFLNRIGRRILGISAELLAFVLMTLLSPLIMLVAALVDLTMWLRRRKPWVYVRLLPGLWIFLFGEIEALIKLPVIYVFTGGPFGSGSIRRRRWIYALRIRWARNHLGAVRILFGMEFDIEGLELTGKGPFILMLRHASILDNLIGDVFIGHRYGIGVRYVIKQEIRALPAIDIGGRWIPTVFIKRGSPDPDTEIAALRRLTHGMSPGEVLAIYPEGTRPTAKKIARAQEIIAERQPEIAPHGRSSQPPSAAAPRWSAGFDRRSGGRHRHRLLRPLRLRRGSDRRRYPCGRPGRQDGPDPLLALPRF